MNTRNKPVRVARADIFPRRDEYDEERRPRFVWEPADPTGTLFDPNGNAEPQIKLARQRAEAARAERRATPQITLTNSEVALVGTIIANKGVLTLDEANFEAQRKRIALMEKRGHLHVEGNKLSLTKHFAKRIDADTFKGVSGNVWTYQNLIIVVIDD